MAFNELEAIKMIDDGKLTDKEIKTLTKARNGLAAEDFRDKNKKLDSDMQELVDKGLIYTVPLSHPRAELQVEALVPTERGITVLNLFDKRYRENALASQDANTAPDVDPKLVKAPTAEEAHLVPSIEAKPLSNEEKALDAPKLSEAAKNDEVFQHGGKNLSDVEEEKTIPLQDAKLTVDGSKFDHDNDGKVGGSKKK
jgi:hypothetical protein